MSVPAAPVDLPGALRRLGRALAGAVTPSRGLSVAVLPERLRPMPALMGMSSTGPVGRVATGGNAGDRSAPATGALRTETADPDDAAHREVWGLVRAAQDGDGDAFGQLYDRYVDTVYRFIYYRVNDRPLAEDLTSETFLRALRRLGSVRYQGRDLAAWFVTIARNLILDHLKSARYRLEVTTEDLLETGEREDSTESAVLASLRNERLLRAVKELSDEQQECIVLRFLHGLSVAETAQVMSKNEGAVKAMQHRAIRRLHTTLAGELP